MAAITQLPCDGDGVCMVCKNTPSEAEILTCKTCATPWHVTCLVAMPENLQSTLHWECPDCTAPETVNVSSADGGPSGVSGDPTGVVASIRAIQADPTLSVEEKALRCQKFMSGEAAAAPGGADGGSGGLPDSVLCTICMKLLDRPVSTPCGHNFCLTCFMKWAKQGNKTCMGCRSKIPKSMIDQPRINLGLMEGIRAVKLGRTNTPSADPKVVPQYMHNQDRPDTAFRSERAKRGGQGNASSGRIFVTVAPDYFGPILADSDPEQNRGVLVGDGWASRLECRQWGVHLPHVAGISGQSKHGAQSVVLSGGYEDDEDHGEWFLYTGSGGRDLSGNKRTNKKQSSDQKFEKSNEALRVSCAKGYPVRVVRSYKEKRSSYAPSLEDNANKKGLRYDGIYRIEKCWRKEGTQGFKVCRYLFIRCDNSPAPWISDGRGDEVRPLPEISELNEAITDLFEREGRPMWDYDNEDGCWKWTQPPPASKIRTSVSEQGRKVKKGRASGEGSPANKKAVKGLCCHICKNLMVLPVTTPCAHNFCKGCLEDLFSGQTLLRERASGSGRSLRARKNVMRCPECSFDIADFLQNPQVNRDLQGVIETFQQKSERGKKKVNEEEAAEDADEEEDEAEEEEEEDNEEEEEEEEEDENAGSERGGDEESAGKDIGALGSPSKRAKVDDGEGTADHVDDETVRGDGNGEN